MPRSKKIILKPGLLTHLEVRSTGVYHVIETAPNYFLAELRRTPGRGWTAYDDGGRITAGPTIFPNLDAAHLWCEFNLASEPLNIKEELHAAITSMDEALESARDLFSRIKAWEEYKTITPIEMEIP